MESNDIGDLLLMILDDDLFWTTGEEQTKNDVEILQSKPAGTQRG